MEYPLRDGKGTKAKSFHEIELEEGTKIGLFQGSKGKNPDLDFIVKYQEKGKSVRTPRHLHWTIDLLIKKEHNRELTLNFVKFLLDMWESVKPIRSKEEQQNPPLKFSTKERLEEFGELDGYGEYSIEFMSTVIELLMIQEKTGMEGAFMFKGVLEAIYNEKDIFSIVAQARHSGR